MAVAEYVTKELAVCVVCGRPAHRSQRLSGDDRRILLGSLGAYEARCRNCFRADGEGETDPSVAQSALPLGDTST
jgi:thymidine kinase